MYEDIQKYNPTRSNRNTNYNLQRTPTQKNELNLVITKIPINQQYNNEFNITNSKIHLK